MRRSSPNCDSYQAGEIRLLQSHPLLLPADNKKRASNECVMTSIAALRKTCPSLTNVRNAPSIQAVGKPSVEKKTDNKLADTTKEPTTVCTS